MKNRLNLLLMLFNLFVVYSCTNDFTKVKVAQFGDTFIYMPLYLADEQGFFREEGLEVSFISTGGDDKTFAAVMSGSATFGIADPAFVAIANEKGFEGKVVGSIVNGVPFYAISKNKDINSLIDSLTFMTYRVATFSSPSTAYTLQVEMFKEYGCTPNIIQGSMGTLLPMIDSKRADIALELEPNVSSAVINGANIVYDFSEKYSEFAFTGVSVADKTITDNPELIRKFMKAISKAESFAHEHPDTAAEIMCSRYPQLQPEVVYSAVLRMINNCNIPKTPVITQESWSNSINLRKRTGDIRSNRDFNELLDLSFLSE